MKRAKKITLLGVGATLILMSGCVSPKTLYYYGDYSESYYATKKEATDENMLALQAAIEKAIENRKDGRSQRVAPGMYANLGYLYLKAGKADRAIENFEKEKATYPEAIIFMDRMINKVKVMEGTNSDK